jgi:hypothetical protein
MQGLKVSHYTPCRWLEAAMLGRHISSSQNLQVELTGVQLVVHVAYTAGSTAAAQTIGLNYF